MNYALHLLVYLAIYVIVALSLNLIVGFCGLLTLAHAAYFAVGGYAYALASLKLGWGFSASVALGVATSALLSLAVSLSAWKFQGDFFVLISLAVQTVLFSLIQNWSRPGAPIGSLANLTNGTLGISGIPRPLLFGTRLEELPALAALAVGAAAACALLAWLLMVSPWGRMLQCIRDDELAARGLGKNVRWAKTQAFAIGCGMVALAGALYAAYVGYLDPSAGALDQSILMLSIVLVGGVGNFRGPLIGAVTLLVLPEVLRVLHIPDLQAANLRLMLYGAAMVLLMHHRPQGIAGSYRVE